MFSQQSKQALTAILSSSLETAFSGNLKSENWHVQALDKNDDINHEEFFLLTISTFASRFFIMLHFCKTESSRKLIAKNLNTSPEALGDTKYYDYLAEVGNIFAGGVKRALGKTIPLLGMSIPNCLAHESMNYISQLNTDYETHARIVSDDDIPFYGSIYISAQDDIEISMPKENNQGNESDSGELELF